MVYNATRATPLGMAPASVVQAAFFRLPSRSYQRLFPSRMGEDHIAEGIGRPGRSRRRKLPHTARKLVGSPYARQGGCILRHAMEIRDTGARALPAGLAALPWPDHKEAHLTIWHAFSFLREYRGDTHSQCSFPVAFTHASVIGSCATWGSRWNAETAPDLSGLVDRQWPAVDPREALKRLCDKGILSEDGGITQAGVRRHLEMERATDAASAPRCAEGVRLSNRLADLLEKPGAFCAPHSAWGHSPTKSAGNRPCLPPGKTCPECLTNL